MHHPRALLGALLLTALPALHVQHALAAQPEPPPPPDEVGPMGLPPAQTDVDTAPPEVAPAVLQRLEAPFLTPAEGRALRVFHGVWREGDLDAPEDRAAAALAVGAYTHPVFDDPGVAPEDRAEARLRAGRPADALAALEGVGTLRAARIRAEALHALGRPEEADAAIDVIAARLASGPAAAGLDAAETTEAVRALYLRTRLRGPEDAARDYRALVGMLAGARTQLDRLDWRPRLAEAELLYAKDNRRDAHQAAREALSMQPRLASGWRLLGQLAVDGFAFEAVGQAADKLDELALSMRGVSADAAEIRARARLRQRDGRGALEALAPALSAYPEHRTLRALEAAAIASTFDRPAADEALGRFEALAPGSALGVYEVGRALAEARQYDWARDYLEEAARREPNWADPWIQLGLMELQAGRDAAARIALVRARALDPFHLRADNSLRLVEELMTWPTIETPHFVIRYREGVDEVLAREMVRRLERIHRRVSGDAPGGADHTPERKTIIELMPDHPWFAVRITGVTDIWTMAASTGPVIALESPRAGPNKRVGPYDWERVVRHEYAHTVNLDRTHNRIPHWFTEAHAVTTEDGPWDERRARLLAQVIESDGLFDFERANIMFVRPEKPTDRAQAYAQSAWMYEYMLERFGNEGPLAIMDAHRDGLTQDEAIRAGLGIESDEFVSDFTNWAGERVAGWGLRTPAGLPTLETLLTREGVRQAAEASGAGSKRAAAEFQLAPAPEPGADPFAPPEAIAPDQIELTPELLDRWLAQYPAHPDLLEIACRRVLERTGNLPRAEHIALFERYAQARPIDPMPHRVLAKMYLDGVGRGLEPPVGPEGAIAHLEWLDAREVYTPAYAVELAKRYAARRDWERATARIDRALGIDPFNAEIRELAAAIALQAGDPENARWQIEALTMIEPDREIHRRRLEALRARTGGG